MIIAIYSNEYGRLEMESDLLFQREPRLRMDIRRMGQRHPVITG